MPSIPNIGDFTRDEQFDDWWESSPVSIPYFGDASIPIRVIDLPESEFLGGGFPDDIPHAILSFLSLTNKDRMSATKLVFHEYWENHAHCRPLLRLLLGRSQVWHYCQPRCATIMRSSEDGKIYLVISFDCEWEIEHGMSFVFQEGKLLSRVGPDDGHIHDPSAYWRNMAEQNASGK